MNRRKIRLIEGNSKCRHLKNLTCKWTLRQVFICLRTGTPWPSPPFLAHCRVYVSTVLWRRSNVWINLGEAAYINLCVLPEKIRELIYSVLIVLTGLALLIKYMQITTVYSIFSILIHTGKGGGFEPERRLEGQQLFTYWLYLQSINSDKHLPQSPNF